MHSWAYRRVTEISRDQNQKVCWHSTCPRGWRTLLVPITPRGMGYNIPGIHRLQPHNQKLRCMHQDTERTLREALQVTPKEPGNTSQCSKEVKKSLISFSLSLSSLSPQAGPMGACRSQNSEGGKPSSPFAGTVAPRGWGKLPLLYVFSATCHLALDVGTVTEVPGTMR